MRVVAKVDEIIYRGSSSIFMPKNRKWTPKSP